MCPHANMFIDVIVYQHSVLFVFPTKMHEILKYKEYSGWKAKQHIKIARLSNSQHWERRGKSGVHRSGS